MLWDVILRVSEGSEVPWAEVLSFLVAMPIALTVHEYAHAKRADMAGDSTPRLSGRVTLNPLAHFDPVGTTMILLFGMGWGKPVPVNPYAFRRLRYDGLMVGFWGPLSNFIAATVFALPLRFGLAGPYAVVLYELVWLNLMLGLFNLIPLGPLDGAGVLSSLLPTPQAVRYDDFNRRWGIMLLLLLLVFGIVRYVVGVPLAIAERILLGRLILGVNMWWRPALDTTTVPRGRSHSERPKAALCHSERPQGARNLASAGCRCACTAGFLVASLLGMTSTVVVVMARCGPSTGLRIALRPRRGPPRAQAKGGSRKRWTYAAVPVGDRPAHANLRSSIERRRRRATGPTSSAEDR